MGTGRKGEVSPSQVRVKGLVGPQVEMLRGLLQLTALVSNEAVRDRQIDWSNGGTLTDVNQNHAMGRISKGEVAVYAFWIITIT